MAADEHMSGTHEPKPNTVVDPVCGMHVDPQKARGTAEHQGKTYYFCSAGCTSKFLGDPEKYLAPKPPTAQMVQLGAIAPAPVTSAATPSTVTGAAETASNAQA